MPRVSIITASYNYEKYIRETIESVLAQTYSDWEMIIIDDGSTDNSVEVIKEYCARDSRIKFFQHEGGVNKGLSETVQLGLKHATSDWVAFLESDDTITPNYLEEKLKIVDEYPNVQFIFNDVQMFGDKKVIKKYDERHFQKTRPLLEQVKYPANITSLFVDRNVVPTFSCVMLKKEILSQVKFESSRDAILDYFLWSQLAPKYDFYYLNKKLTNWRMHKNSYIHKKERSDAKKIIFMYQVTNNLGVTSLDDVSLSEIGKYYAKYKKHLRLFKGFFVVSCVEAFIILVIALCFIYWGVMS